jgi:hypothetical protein
VRFHLALVVVVALAAVADGCARDAPRANDPVPLARDGGAPSDARRSFACGHAACVVGKQVCCERGDDARTCVPNAPKDDDERAHPWMICRRLVDGPRANYVSGATCDDSGDCGAAGVCCSEYLAGTPPQVECKPMEKDGVRTCALYELCVETATCRTPGATCVRGSCVPKRAVTIACGDATCNAATDVCCALDHGRAKRCATASQCDRDGGEGFACTSPRDCASGERCLTPPSWLPVANPGAGCAHYEDPSISRLCATDADCDAQRPRCEERENGFRFCAQ